MTAVDARDRGREARGEDEDGNGSFPKALHILDDD